MRFVDTNVLLYAVSVLPEDADKRRRARQIELLREYRTWLIADVATGQVDVREAAANLPNHGEKTSEETGT